MNKVVFATAMAQAMVKGIPQRNAGKVGHSVIKAMQAGAGLKKVNSWNAHLKKKTYDTLVANGVYPVGN